MMLNPVITMVLMEFSHANKQGRLYRIIIYTDAAYISLCISIVGYDK